ncbi:N-acetyltransferase 8-like 2 [Pholidichthys leucotaenia]
MQVLIRQYRSSDKDAVLNLFCDGTLEHIYPCFRNAMTSPLYLTITLALCVTGFLLGSVFGAVLLPVAWVSLIYYCSHELYSCYVRCRLQTDMQDITGSFMSRPDDCFWVAEAEVEGRAHIVGMVAVMAKEDLKEKQGELFRMIIYPHCRRMGIGYRLTQTVIDFCKERGFSKVVLERSSTQTAGVALYKKLGFSLVLSHTKAEAHSWIILLTRVKILRMEKHLCLK